MSLKDRKLSETCIDFCVTVQRVAEVVRWFGHVEHKSGDDWVLACRNMVVARVRCVGRGRKTWRECVKDGTDELGLNPEWAVFRDMWRDLIAEEMDVLEMNDDECLQTCLFFLASLSLSPSLCHLPN